MNHLSKKQHTKYNTIAVRADDDDTVVPLVTHPPTPPRTNDDHGGKTKKQDRGPIIVSMILLLVFGLALYTGGPFDGGDSLRCSDGNLVDGTDTSVVQANQCVPPTNDFKGFSKTTFWGSDDPFQTCFHLGRAKKRKDEANCCWTNSFYRGYGSDSYRGDATDSNKWYECLPGGLFEANYWHASYDSNNPVTCGLPCQNMHEDTNTA